MKKWSRDKTGTVTPFHPVPFFGQARHTAEREGSPPSPPSYHDDNDSKEENVPSSEGAHSRTKSQRIFWSSWKEGKKSQEKKENTFHAGIPAFLCSLSPPPFSPLAGANQFVRTALTPSPPPPPPFHCGYRQK